jgi:NAD(P)-dependent dehydrogenase (short-subunit alcohol dehydrogenase family)
MPYETFVRTLNVNICGTFLSVQKSLPLLHTPRVARPTDHPARIVILTSTADGGRYAGRSAYISSKAAQTRFIDNLANEQRETGVDVYGIYPGFTRTAMAEPMIQGTYHHVMFPEEKAKYLEWIAKGAIEGPEWCGEACAQLSVGAAKGLKGKTAYYSVHVPEFKHGDIMSSRLQIAPA